MFTGLIQDIGTITALDQQGDWTVAVATRHPLTNLAVGASIACSGVCLTVLSSEAQGFTVQVSAETLEKTTARDWRVGTRLNLERALKMGDELGGHLLLGHVDGVGRVIDKRQEGESLRLTYELPDTFARFLAPKGSIALDGVSLTINDVEGARFGVNLIPHTQAETTLGACAVGSKVNFEVDMMARYIDRLLAQRSVP